MPPSLVQAEFDTPPLDHLAAFATPVKLPPQPVSRLMLADRLITAAQDADRAGCIDMAVHLVALVYSVLDPETPPQPAIGPVAAASWRRPVRKPARKAGQLRRAGRGEGTPSQTEA